MPEASGNSLNSNHERRLSVTCRHIDKLLADMESSLNVSTSKLAFPQYMSDLSPAQRRVIEDYIGRLRAQLIRVLDGQEMERPRLLFRGIEGYGASTLIHKHHLLRSSDQPIMISVIDTEDKIKTLIPALDQMVDEGLIAMSDVEVIRYVHQKGVRSLGQTDDA